MSPNLTSRVSEDQNSQESQQITGVQSSIDDYDSYEEASVAGSGSESPSSTHGVNGSQATGHNNQILQTTQKTASWRINWREPVLMAGFLIAGIALALGHHFYYRSLDGTVVSSDTRQEWALRFGTAFAFLTHTLLVASAAVAYTQRVWVTVKRKHFRLETLDNVFSLQANPFSFLSWEVLAKAKALCLLGLCIWYVHVFCSPSRPPIWMSSLQRLETSG